MHLACVCVCVFHIVFIPSLVLPSDSSGATKQRPPALQESDRERETNQIKIDAATEPVNTGSFS